MKGLLALLLLVPGVASAQMTCMIREAFVGTLTGQMYEEVPMFGGTAPNAQPEHPELLVEFFANAETGTWSFLITGPDGVSCLLAAGQNFVLAPPIPPGQPS